MTVWQKLYLLARFNDLLMSLDRKKVAEYVDGLQGTGKLSDEDITDYLEFWQINKINELYEKYHIKIIRAL